MAETEKQPLLTREGPGVHRDLCHGASVTRLKWFSERSVGAQGGGKAHTVMAARCIATQCVSVSAQPHRLLHGSKLHSCRSRL